jgi:6-phospho-3-hexuloisomerase
VTAFLDLIVREVAETSQRVEPAEIVAAAWAIAAGESVHVTGQGRSGLVGRMFAMRLMHLGMFAHVVGDPTEPAVTSRDVLVVVSASGATPTCVHQATVARALGAGVVLVTRDADPAIGNLAEVVVVIPGRASSQLGGNAFEQCSLLALDAVTLTLAAEIPDAAERLLRRHANLQ